MFMANKLLYDTDINRVIYHTIAVVVQAVHNFRGVWVDGNIAVVTVIGVGYIPGRLQASLNKYRSIAVPITVGINIPYRAYA